MCTPVIHNGLNARELGGYQLYNATAAEISDEEEDDSDVDAAPHELAKRVFQTDHRRWRTDDVKKYLPGQVRVTDGRVVPTDKQFSSTLGFFAGGTNQATVAVQRKFSKKEFQMGTGGLHGCTMMAIISNRGVWMVSIVYTRFSTLF